jgi:hypothetical protein
LKFLCHIIILIYLFSGIKSYGNSVEDTSRIVTNKFTGSLSSSFTNSSNWKGTTFNSLSAALDLDFNRSRNTPRSTTLFLLNSELGFTKFIDSIWNKYADKLNCNYIWKNKKRKIDHSCTFSFNAQMLNSYLHSYDPVLNKTNSEWTGSFFNPAKFEIGYGFGYSFWEKSMLSLSISTIRFRTEPNISSQSIKSKDVIGRINRGKLLFDYGVSANALTTKEFTSKITLNSNVRIFMKGINKESVELDASHKINYIIWKWFQLRADLKMIYDPGISLKMQYRNELLFGMFYDSDKKFD